MPPRHKEKLYSIDEREGKLVVERRGEPFRKRYVVLIVLLVALLALLIGYLIASQMNRWLWFLVALVVVVLLAVAERAYRMYSATKPNRMVFDKDADLVERNGEQVGVTNGAEAVLFRDILDGERQTNEHAVVVSYENTRRLLVAESHGIPGEKESLEAVAKAVSDYVGVPIRNEPRQVDQWWMDRS